MPKVGSSRGAGQSFDVTDMILLSDETYLWPTSTLRIDSSLGPDSIAGSVKAKTLGIAVVRRGLDVFIAHGGDTGLSRKRASTWSVATADRWPHSWPPAPAGWDPIVGACTRAPYGSSVLRSGCSKARRGRRALTGRSAPPGGLAFWRLHPDNCQRLRRLTVTVPVHSNVSPRPVSSLRGYQVLTCFDGGPIGGTEKKLRHLRYTLGFGQG